MTLTRLPSLGRLFVVLVVTLVLLVSSEPTGTAARPGGAALAVARAITDEELVRNGGFELDKAAWTTNPIGTYAADGFGNDGVGKGMQIWPEFSDPYIGFIYQEIHLPTLVTEAAFRMDYQFVPDTGAGIDYFRAALATASATLATLVEVSAGTYPGETWQSSGAFVLGTDALNALNAAHSAGERVYVLVQLRAQSLRVNVDNVSLRVAGSREYPDWTGSIAYVGLDETGAAQSVRRVDPDGANPRTLWVHPLTGLTAELRDVAWRPDAGEVAFASNHESLYSAFRSDVYGIGQEGGRVRRITNPPSKADLDEGGRPVGTVTGKVLNDYGAVTTILLYVQGAREAVSIPATAYRQEAAFSVPDVAFLGTGLHYVVFTWSAAGSANCKEYAAAVVQVVPGQTTDAGTLRFAGTCGEYDASTITWKRDGTEIAADVVTPRRFLASGQSIGSPLFDAPLLADNPAWSPVDDRVLYYDGSYGQKGISLTTAGGGRGTLAVRDESALWVAPAWLPDGSGFVYAHDNSLSHHDLATGQSVELLRLPGEILLDPSVSPDGRYVVIEVRTGATSHDLWLVDRSQPVNVWHLTRDGRSTKPDWSRVDPPTGATTTATASRTTTSEPTATPTGTEAPTVTPTGTDTPTATGRPSPTSTGTATEGATAATVPPPIETDTPTPASMHSPTATPASGETPGPGTTQTATLATGDTPTPAGQASETPSPAPTEGVNASATPDDRYYVYLPVANRNG